MPRAKSMGRRLIMTKRARKFSTKKQIKKIVNSAPNIKCQAIRATQL